MLVKFSSPYHSMHAEGSGPRRRGFSTTPWGDTLLPLLLMPIPPAVAAAVQCLSPSVWKVLWVRYARKEESGAHVSECVWMHQHNLLSIASVPHLGMTANIWKLKTFCKVHGRFRHSRHPSNYSVYSAVLGCYSLRLVHIKQKQHSREKNENKAGSHELWYSRYGKSL